MRKSLRCGADSQIIMRLRNYKIDNFRAFLMLCVVAGHLCDAFGFPYQDTLYRFIYTFHMPAFVFLSGVFATGDLKKIAKNYFYPLAVFQVLFFLFRCFVLGETSNLLLTKPYWALWYLMSLAWWNIMLPLFETKDRKKRGLYVILCICAALAVGFFPDVGYAFSLSRTIVYQPFFLVGHYLKGRLLCEENRQKPRWKKGILVAGAVILVLAFAFATLSISYKLKKTWFFGSSRYGDGHTVWVRAALLASAAVLTAVFWILMPNKRLPLISRIGEHTMPIYLLHGFVVLSLRKWKIPCSGWQGLGIMLALTVAMSVLFSLPIVVRVTKPLMRWPFDRKKEAVCDLQEKT